MSIVKAYCSFIVACDECMPATDSWNEALSEAKEAGWQSKCINGTWENYCPECKED